MMSDLHCSWLLVDFTGAAVRHDVQVALEYREILAAAV